MTNINDLYRALSRVREVPTRRATGQAVMSPERKCPAVSDDRNDPDDVDDPDELPSKAGELAERYPDVWEAYAGLGAACADAGPIDGETKRLVKLALAIGSQSEGAVHSHVRRALEEGVDPETLKHAAILSVPTVGFPKAVAALSWIEDLTAADDE